jgi:hypothetical protein
MIIIKKYLLSTPRDGLAASRIKSRTSSRNPSLSIESAGGELDTD